MGRVGCRPSDNDAGKRAAPKERQLIMGLFGEEVPARMHAGGHEHEAQG